MMYNHTITLTWIWPDRRLAIAGPKYFNPRIAPIMKSIPYMVFLKPKTRYTATFISTIPTDKTAIVNTIEPTLGVPNPRGIEASAKNNVAKIASHTGVKKPSKNACAYGLAQGGSISIMLLSLFPLPINPTQLDCSAKILKPIQTSNIRLPNAQARGAPNRSQSERNSAPRIKQATQGVSERAFKEKASEYLLKEGVRIAQKAHPYGFESRPSRTLGGSPSTVIASVSRLNTKLLVGFKYTALQSSLRWLYC